MIFETELIYDEGGFVLGAAPVAKTPPPTLPDAGAPGETGGPEKEVGCERAV